jgi:hypothetical protein
LGLGYALVGKGQIDDAPETPSRTSGDAAGITWPCVPGGVTMANEQNPDHLTCLSIDGAIVA